MLSTRSRMDGVGKRVEREVNRPKIFPFILMSSVASSFCSVHCCCFCCICCVLYNVVFIFWFIKIITFALISHNETVFIPHHHLKGKWVSHFFHFHSLSLQWPFRPHSNSQQNEWLKRSMQHNVWRSQCDDEWHLRVDINWKYFHELNWELINIIFAVWTTSWPESMCGHTVPRCERKNIVGQQRVRWVEELENCKLNFYANFKLSCVYSQHFGAFFSGS